MFQQLGFSIEASTSRQSTTPEGHAIGTRRRSLHA
jgi:hypothetical protein